MTGVAMLAADESALRARVERLLSFAHGHPVKVVGLTREPSAWATLAPAEVVTATVDDGCVVSLFVKQLDGAPTDHPEKRLRDRELRVYEELLGDPHLPVPRYLGSSRHEAGGGRVLLFLEHVDGWSLKHHGLPDWYEAARRLAHLHAHFADQDLATRDYLLHFDAEFVLSWRRRAVEAVREQRPMFARRLERALAGYERAAALIGGQPSTLVHNDLSPKNVVIDRGTSGRVYFVDWELAGVGCGLLDLVHLRYGLDARSAERMLAAYRAELVGTGLLPADCDDLRRLEAACELHKTLYRLWCSRLWRLEPPRVGEWVEDAERLAALV